jgi:hypothetical protein
MASFHPASDTSVLGPASPDRNRIGAQDHRLDDIGAAANRLADRGTAARLGRFELADRPLRSFVLKRSPLHRCGRSR